ncbi:MAG: aminoglycoside phosphotransferase family protein, partial [Chloroflexota bacterium]|nr:aminoglycoside phosphotransferase family protein [Chloroflexota bacterium]
MPLTMQVSALEASLRACLLPPAGGGALSIQSATEITPGLSGSRLFRVRLRPEAIDDPDVQRAPAELGQSLILKVPDWGTPTSLASRDAGVGLREIHFYESGLAARLPEGLRAPRLLGIDHTPPDLGTWLWTEDVATALAVHWTPERALAAARSAGRLHALFVAEQAELARQGWLERDGYAAYAHHMPAAHCHLVRLPTHPHWSHLFTHQERAALHRALDLTPWAITELRRLPPTLVHGDFHVDNLGCDPDGTVV